VGAGISIDVGEAAIRSGAFTTYDTTVAIAYADKSNGDLKYARLDVDDPSATWYIAVVHNTDGVANIDLNLHAGPSSNDLQAQIAYQEIRRADVRYAYRNTRWYVQRVATDGTVGGSVQLSFDGDDNPAVTYYNAEAEALYTSTRTSTGSWTTAKTAAAAMPMSIALNERTGASILSFQHRRTRGVLNKIMA